MKHLSTLFILLCCSGAMAQQYGQNYKNLADRAFSNRDYYEAAYYYKKVAENMKMSADPQVPYQPGSAKSAGEIRSADKTYISYHLAESYRMYENYREAEGWYNRVLNDNAESIYPLTRLWYGISLRANQHFDEALKQLAIFNASYKGEKQYQDLAAKEIANCNFAKEQYQNPLTYEVVKQKGQWNSDGSNYAVFRKDKNYWMTSSRMLKDDKQRLNRIYHLTDNAAKPELITFKDPEGKKETEYGTPSLDPTGKRMYFTRWQKEGKNISRGIYVSEWSGSEWSSPFRLNTNVNAQGFSSIQPFVTANGRQLYFVSDKPGGQGKDDIWVSDLDDQGRPVNSRNLGPEINTSFDEQAPYYSNSDRTLIYSSKGLTGLGGFDFFRSSGETGKWTKPVNMGYPLNSPKDDLYYFPAEGKEFYISSDRESDCCLNVFLVSDNSYNLSGKLTDCGTGKPLSDVRLRITDPSTGALMGEAITDKEARYTFRIFSAGPVNISMEKSGYFSKSVPLSSVDRSNAALCLQAFEAGKAIALKDVFYDYNKASLRPESRAVLNQVVNIMKDNPTFKIELGAHTDAVGSEAYNQKLSQERAEECVQYIVSKGINPDRIFAKGYGESRPVASNTTPDGKDNPEGRQLNRRTEFTVLKEQ